MPQHLAQLSAQHGFKLVFISTDYVFNGRPGGAPYEVDAEPDPLQSYGLQKRDGENAVKAERAKSGAQATILRVPILYGATTYNAESAVNILRDGQCPKLPVSSPLPREKN